ncbi:hypothetical protein MMC15_008493 [Xylographa vitiligo]|nr:hypothetical protein [Xylographa vitiligo]
MEVADGSFGQLRDLAERYASGLLLTLALLVMVAALTSRSGTSRQPPRLSDPIPFVFNTLQFVLDNEKFMKRVKCVAPHKRNALKATSLVKFYQGTNLVYLVSGPKNVQAIFGRSHNVNNDDIMLRLNLPTWYRLSKTDLKRFAADKSGRGRVPLASAESMPQHRRYFFGYEHVHNEYLAKTQYLNPLVEHYRHQICQALDGYRVHESTTLSVRDFCKREVTRCALHTLIGPKIFELTPNFLDLLWDFDDVIFSLAVGFPRWVYSRPHKVHERFLAAVQGYLDSAWAHFDWNTASPAAWEPHFGAQVSREVVKWFRDSELNGPDTGAGAIGILAWAQNSNVIPTMMWMIVHIAHDPSLIHALREEVNTAYVSDPDTGSRTLDIQKLTALPLLTSVYTETLRLSMSFNVMRNVQESFDLDGYTIQKGALVQVPTLVAHYDEDVWAAEKHPASEFWAERHIKYTDETDDRGHVVRKRVFAMAGRSGSYFPYADGTFLRHAGGGNLICPGRHFAKQQIMLTAGLLVSKFDLEFVAWTMPGGAPADRPPRNDRRFCGSGSAPPDRDMRIRLRRLAPP